MKHDKDIGGTQNEKEPALEPCGRTQYEFNVFGTIPFRTCLPITAAQSHPRLRNLVACTNEALEADCREVCHTPYVVDGAPTTTPGGMMRLELALILTGSGRK